MTIITTKRTLSTEVRLSPRAPVVVNSGHPAEVGPNSERATVAKSSIQNLTASRAISERRKHHHHKCAPSRSRAVELGEKSSRVLVSNRLCRDNGRSKNPIARSKNTQQVNRTHWGQMVYINSDQRSKNAQIGTSPNQGFGRKILVQNNIRAAEGAQGNTVKIPSAAIRLLKLNDDTQSLV
jgi:hypothetical protein